MPDHSGAAGGLADCASRLCDWSQRDAIADDMARRIGAGASRVSPLVAMRYHDDPALQLAGARQYAAGRGLKAPRGAAPRPAADGPIRLAYLSADFRQHPVAQLIADLIERHDRTRFTVAGISLGPDDGSALRGRLVRAFDRFHDATAMSDRDAAQLIAGARADIVIDLGGYTTGCRPEILRHRPAPVAAGWLGYPGTMGVDVIDYILADPVALPLALEGAFTEKIVHLRDCYMPGAPWRPLAAPVPSRRAARLPEQGFVFCAFNNPAKIAPAMFAAWMRILAAVPDSVLWLAAAGDAAANLRREAASRGIDPDRLVFAPRTADFDDHLARHRVAGLFLDTLPYNAHTTACDALRAGLPVLTCRGNAMAGRVAASLLHAVGLPELVTTSLAGYEETAIRLATDPPRLAATTAKLAGNLPTAALFDADRFRDGMEGAFSAMWERHRHGERPRHLALREGAMADLHAK
jgi:protein O-GlcNAc transferase